MCDPSGPPYLGVISIIITIFFSCEHFIKHKGYKMKEKNIEIVEQMYGKQFLSIFVVIYGFY